MGEVPGCAVGGIILGSDMAPAATVVFAQYFSRSVADVCVSTQTFLEDELEKHGGRRWILECCDNSYRFVGTMLRSNSVGLTNITSRPRALTGDSMGEALS